MTDDNTIELNRRRVLGGIVTVGAAAAAAGAGTFAAFSDTEESTGNTVDAGTLDLSSNSDGVISATDIVPGDTVSGTVTSTYNGSVDAEVDVSFSITEPSEETEPSSNNTELSAAEFAQELEVTTAEVDIGSSAHTESLLGSTTDANGNGYVDLDDLVNAGNFDAVTGNNAVDGEDVSVTLDLTFRSDAGNAAQADGVDITVALTAEQPSAD